MGLGHDPAGLRLGDQPDPGTVQLDGQSVHRRGDGREPVVAGAPELGWQLGQQLGGRSKEPGRALTHGVLEHVF